MEAPKEWKQCDCNCCRACESGFNDANLKIPLDAWANDTPHINLNLDDPDVDAAMHRWGGSTLLRITIFQGGKKIHCFVSARVSGDSRAGNTKGAHLRMEVRRRNTDTTRRLHAMPWDDINPKEDTDAS